MRRCVLLLFVLALLGFAPAPLPRQRREPPNPLFGTWMRGQERMVLTEGLMSIHVRGEVLHYGMKIDPTARPMTFDLRGIDPASVKGRSYEGIYRVEGDRLTMCYSSKRPANFEGRGMMHVEEYVRAR